MSQKKKVKRKINVRKRRNHVIVVHQASVLSYSHESFTPEELD